MNADQRRKLVERLSLAAPDDKLLVGITALLAQLRDNEVATVANPLLDADSGQFARGRLAMALDVQAQWDEALQQAAMLRPGG
jgi:hypothetical protein